MDFIRVGRVPLLLLCGFGLVGIASMACAQTPKGTTNANPSGTPPVRIPVPAPTPATPPSATAEPLGLQEKATDFAFSYRYPALAATWPGLVAWLDNDARAQRARLAKGASDERIRAAQEGATPFLPFQIESEWKVVTNLPGWLSLSQTEYSYMGGAHPHHQLNSLLWDKGAQQARRPISIFISDAALDQAVQPALCAELGLPRANPSTTRNPDDSSLICPGTKDATIRLRSSQRQAFDQIDFFFDGYLVTGSRMGREVTLPVTPAVIAAVRPEFRSAFALAH